MIDIGGYKLYLDCRDEGSPTVVLDYGLEGVSSEWTLDPDADQPLSYRSYSSGSAELRAMIARVSSRRRTISCH
jgi:hypothetical protein